MSMLELIYSDGQWDALAHYKLAMPRAHFSTAGSTLLTGAAPKATLPQETLQQLQPPTSPQTLKSVFDVQEQGKTRSEPARKMAADICTTCRHAKHYGPCPKPKTSKRHGEPLKKADFNMGLTGHDPKFVRDEGPATSPGYSSATSADSALARAPQGRPADEQAASGFADFFRHGGISNVADEPGRQYGGLNKVSDFMLGSHEQRGPSVNPYEERLTRKSPPVAWGPEGPQATAQAFRSHDVGTNTDTSSIGGMDTSNIGGF